VNETYLYSNKYVEEAKAIGETEKAKLRE